MYKRSIFFDSITSKEDSQTRQIVFAVVLLIVLLTGVSSFGQGVVVGPDCKFSKQTLSLPYAFYNESFGFSLGYVKGVVGYPQKQSTLLATVMAGTTGSAMDFLVERDIQMPQNGCFSRRVKNYSTNHSSS